MLTNPVLYLFNRRSDVAMSRLTDKSRQLPSQDLRKAIHHHFDDMSVVPMSPNHSHGRAASLRTSSSAKIGEVILNAGLTPYWVSKSGRAQEIDGCRYNFMDKDLNKPFQDTPLRPDHVLVMIDVDYHVESINRFLEYGNALVIYTFVPEKAAGATTDAVFSITDDVVTYRVNGGAVYKHKLWRYFGDTVSVIDKYGNLLVYAVEQTVLAADPQRRIIGFYPTMTCPPWTYRSPTNYGVNRWRLSDGNGFNVVANPVNETVSFSQTGACTSATVSTQMYECVRIRLANAAKPVVADVERILSANKVEGALLMAPVLYEKLMNDAKSPERRKTDETTSTGSVLRRSAVNFQAAGPLATEDGKEMGRAVAPSILTNSAVFACRSYNNDVATVDGRITNIANVMVPPPSYHNYAQELLLHLVPVAGIGAPLSLDDVYYKQSRPAQRARANNGLPSVTVDYTTKLRSMIKSEAYSNITDPRNISTVNTAHQMQYSCYTLAFKEDVLSKRKWYASDMTPDEINRRVQEVASYPDGLIVSDYSRLDGHISPYEKAFKERVYLRWCSPVYRADLAKILKQDSNCKGVTSSGFKYNSGSSQLSGSPGTTPDNNLVTALHDYTALRELGHTPEVAWALFQQWIVGASDDRVRANLPGLSEMVVDVCTKHGHKLKNAVYDYNDAIIFLGRLFPHPATHLASMQDPFRTLAKLHLTTSPDSVDALAALRNKAAGYYVTDSHSPIIGVWCAQVLKLTETVPAVQMTREESFKLEMGPWPQESTDVLYEAFSLLTGLSNSEVLEIEEICKRAETIAELPESVLDNGYNVKVALTAVLDGIVHHAPDSKECHSTTPTPPESSPQSEPARLDSSEPQLNLPSAPPSPGTTTSNGTEPTCAPSTVTQPSPLSQGCSTCLMGQRTSSTRAPRAPPPTQAGPRPAPRTTTRPAPQPAPRPAPRSNRRDRQLPPPAPPATQTSGASTPSRSTGEPSGEQLVSQLSRRARKNAKRARRNATEGPCPEIPSAPPSEPQTQESTVPQLAPERVSVQAAVPTSQEGPGTSNA